MTAHKPLTTAVVEDGSGRLELDCAELRVTRGPDRGAALALGAASVRIGTAADCDLVLRDPAVSRYHAEIALGPRGYVLRDLGSKNGILAGNVPIERAGIAGGMRFSVGDTTIAVHALGQRTSIPLVRPGELPPLVAHSVQMRAVVAVLQRLATSEMTVLLEGETGTGKDVAAHAVHLASSRAAGPFIVFDCGGVASSLLANELFGHQRGAFTGADEGKAGLFQEADGGTLFLDEVGEIPLDLQPFLLRMIESKSVRPLGASREQTYDVRLIAATNRNLREEVRARRFREDLYFRLAAGRARLPPLRERREDIAVLAEEFAEELGLILPPSIVAMFTTYEWPGNVRELRNTIERLAVETPEQVAAALVHETGSGLAPVSSDGWRTLAQARREAITTSERAYLERALTRAEGGVARAAELAGISRQMFSRLMTRHNIGRDTEP